jgi:putative ABC transport system permease protein
MSPRQWLYIVPLRLRSIFHRQQVDSELRDELQYHLDMKIEENVVKGMSREEARRTALLAIGGLDQKKEECRDARGFRFIGEIRKDFCYAVRQLGHNPGFAILAILVLALGIGANTAVVSIIDQLIFRPLPVLEPEQLVSISQSSYLDYIDLRNDGQVFSAVASTDFAGFELWDSDHSKNLSARSVSANFFDVLGLKMAAGRPFLPEEDQPSRTNPVAIISYRLWQSMFGSDPGAVGSVIRLNGEILTIVGVAPKRFRDIDYSSPYRDIWVPLPMFKRLMHLEGDPMFFDLFEQRNKRFLYPVGRLKPGVSLAQAQARMGVFVEQLRRAYPDSRKSWGAKADGSLSDDEWNISLFSFNSPRMLQKNTWFSLNVLFIASGCILLICCANVGSLLLARAAARRAEIATRLAIGASRFRIIRQLLTECFVLSSVSLVASFAVWRLTLQCLPEIEGSLGGSIGIPRDLELMFEPRIFFLAALITVLANAIFALVPALLGSRFELTMTLKEQSLLKGSAAPHWRRILVVAQVILSFVLLVGAGLFIRFIASFESVNPGFDLKVLVVNPGAPGYGLKNQKNVDYHRRALERINALPGVLAASWASDVPPEMGQSCWQYVRPEQTGSINDSYHPIDCNAVSPGYFKTLQIPLIEGRDFTDRDDAHSPAVIVVNETMARRFWPGANPLGKRLQMGRKLGYMLANREQLFEVIGVVKDAGYPKVWNGARPYAYFVPAQLGYQDGSSRLHVRVVGNPESMINPIRKVFESFGPEAKVRDARLLSAELEAMLSRERSSAFVLSLFGGLAFLLAGIGLYGVVSYSAASRRREFGIRLALGAQNGNIVRLVIREAVLTIIVGLVIGIPLSVAATRFLQSRLHGISSLDPVAYVVTSVLWIALAVVAAIVPAKRALSNPINALRFE